MSTNVKEKKIINLNTPLAWSIESVSDLIKLGNIDVENRVCYPCLMKFDEPTRNTSVYDGESLRTSITESRIWNESIRTGSLFGELGHPDIELGQNRFLKVDMNNISHRIVNYKFVGNEMHAKVQFRKPKGDILWDWVSSGTNLAFSIRALTPTFVKKQNNQGQTYIYKYGKMLVVTFDSVLLPGVENARLVNPQSYNASLESMTQWVESNPRLQQLKMSLEEADWRRMINAPLSQEKVEVFNHSDLKILMRSQESAHIIEDLFKFSVEDAEVRMDSEKVYLKPQGSKDTLIIPTNTYIINKILGSSKKVLK